MSSSRGSAGQILHRNKPDNHNTTAVTSVNTSQNIQYDAKVRSHPGCTAWARFTFSAAGVTNRDASWTTRYHPNAQRHAERSMRTLLSAIIATASPPTCARVEVKNIPQASTT